MANKVTLKNPVANQVLNSVSIAKRSIDIQGKSLNTGINANNDVISVFLGKGLNDQSTILNKILTNISYGTDIIASSQLGLEGIANLLTDSLGIVAQAIPNSPNLGTLQASLDKNLAEIARITSTTQFDGTTLLTGGLSNKSGLTPKSPNNNSVTASFPLADAKFLDGGVKGVTTLTVAGGTAPGEIVTVAGKQFTAIVAGQVPTAGQFVATGVATETAQNLALAIENSALTGLSVQVNNAGVDIVLTQKTPSTLNLISAIGSANVLAVITTAPTASGLDLSGIKNVTSFVNAPVINFALDQQILSAGGTNAARTLAQSLGAIANYGGAGNADAAASFTATVNGKVFKGAAFQLAANLGNTNNVQIKMISQSGDGDYFVINNSGANADQIDTPANALTATTAINTFLQNVRFAQNQILDIDTKAGNIISQGVTVGSLTGMNATFQSSNFAGQKFVDFKILAGAALGDVVFNATINNGTTNITYTSGNITAANIPTLIAGYAVNFTNTTNTDTFTLNLGQQGLTSLSQPGNYTPVATAIKKALMGNNGLQVRTGLSYTDVTAVNIGDVSANLLYLDNAGAYEAAIDLQTQTNAQKATEVLTNALRKIRNEQASLQSDAASIDGSSTRLEALIQLTQDASDDYLDTNLIDAASAFAAAVKAMTAAISTLGAGARVADAAQDIIRQAAA